MAALQAAWAKAGLRGRARCRGSDSQGATDFGKGVVVDGAWGTVTATYHAVTHPVATVSAVYEAASHPIETGKALVAAAEQTVEKIKQGDMRALGQATFEIATIVVPASKLGGAAKAADKASDAAKATKAAKATNAAKIAKKVPCACFAAGTLVLTARGLRPIEEIQVGDWVWAQDDEGSGDAGWREVLDTHQVQRLPLVEINVVDESGAIETIRATTSHPFWVENTGWLEAEKLGVGFTLADLENKSLTIVSIETLNQIPVTYNLSIDGYETFFVGQSGVWAHNCPPGGAAKGAARDIVKWDGEFATKQLLGSSTAPGGKQVNFHAADRMVNPPKGRVPMSVEEVDDFVDTADAIKKIKITDEGTSVTLLNSKYPKAQIAVDGNRVITVVNPNGKR